MGLYVILIGPQGAGKGVQAKFIQEQYGIPHVSTGDLFRAMRTREDALARDIQQTMAAGNLVSDEQTNKVVEERLAQPDAKDGVIFDGYPRNAAQAEWLEKHLAGQDKKVNSVLLLDLDLYIAFKRAFGRVKSPEDENVTYNIYFDDAAIEWEWVKAPENEFPPRLKAVEKSSRKACVRRPDDADAASVIKRIDTYLETTQPLIEYYREKGLVREVNAEESIEQVSRAIKKLIDGTL